MSLKFQAKPSTYIDWLDYSLDLGVLTSLKENTTQQAKVEMRIIRAPRKWWLSHAILQNPPFFLSFTLNFSYILFCNVIACL